MEGSAQLMRKFQELIALMDKGNLPLDGQVAANVLWGMNVARASHPEFAAKMMDCVTQGLGVPGATSAANQMSGASAYDEKL